MLVTVIIPVQNAELFIRECLQSIEKQSFTGDLEVSIFDDGSEDDSAAIIEQWRRNLKKENISVILGHNDGNAKGVGFAKNQAINQSNGEFLCFLDADDVMHPNRIEKQLPLAAQNEDAIIGCRFWREPQESTFRYSNWANNLLTTNEQFYLQIFTSNGPTLIMPTWFCSRNVVDKVGGFCEQKDCPEDLIFFFKHLRLQGKLFRVDDELLMYRYHPQQTTFRISEEQIWNIRLREFEEVVLSKWQQFSIWSCGKEGRKFYRSLSEQYKRNVVSFCDVDQKKIDKRFYVYEESSLSPKPRVKIVHFSEVKPPLVICVKLGLTKGVFERNLASLNLKEGDDYYHFA